jgi:zinc transport system substrate-binding protein
MQKFPQRLKIATGLLVVACLTLPACRRDTTTSNPAKNAKSVPQVYVTNYPLKYFSERIAAGSADVRFPMSTDGDPAHWEPAADIISQYQSADLILINGANYEGWLASATLPEGKIVDTSAAFRDEYIQVDDAITHSHGPEGEHSHAGTAFTTWLDFQQAEQQVTAIQEALTKLNPDRGEDFRKNADALRADLKQLDESMTAVAEMLADRPLVVSHPVYQYWTRRYKLKVESVHWEPDVVPSEEAMNALTEMLKNHPAQVMIWEGAPEQASIDKLQGLGIDSVVFAPAGNIDESGDWLMVMRNNIAALKAWAEKQQQ